MKKVERFDRNACGELRAELNRLLMDFGSQHGLHFKIGNMRFSDSEVSMKLETKIIGAKTRADAVLEQMIDIYNLDKSNAFGELVEYNSKAHKYPFVYRKASDGKKYVTSLDFAKMYFKKAS